MEWPLLIVRPDKTPLHKGWPSKVLSADDVLGNPGLGLAIKLGGESRLLDLEGDGPGAERQFRTLVMGMPQPTETTTWSSSRGLHRVFCLPYGVKPPHSIVKIGDLEVRFGNPDRYTHYSIIPPCGGREWVNEREPAELPLEIFERICRHAEDIVRSSSPSLENIDSPGTVFNERVTWDELLPRFGWKRIGTRGEGITDWVRPGKSAGLSATTGYCGDLFYVFTTNAEPLSAGKAYDKFAFYSLMKHGGDFSAAASTLASKGYVRTVECNFPVEKPTDEPTLHVPTDKLLFPGFVRDFAEFHAKRSHRADLRSGAVGGIVLQSWLMGRRVMLEDGTRPNISALLLGRSATGKTATVDTMERVLSLIGCQNQLYRQFKSWQGLEDAIQDTPNMIYVQEEAQDILRGIVNSRDQNQAQLATTLKQLITASKSSFRPRIGAKQTGLAAPVAVQQPHLSLLFTGLPVDVWGEFSDRLIRDGFAGRLWPVELTEVAARNRKPSEDTDILSVLLDHCDGWTQVVPSSEDSDATEGVTEVVVKPRVIKRTEDSRKLADAFALEADRRTATAEEVESSIWGRAHELLCTLELLIVGSRTCRLESEGGSVLEEDTIRALEIVRLTISQKLVSIEGRQGNSDFHQKITKLLRQIKRLSGDEDRADWTRIQRAMSPMKVLEFSELVCAACGQGSVVTDARFTSDGARVAHRGTYLKAV